MTISKTLSVLVFAVTSTSFVHAESSSGPILLASFSYTDTCDGTPNKGFSALDIDADGRLSSSRDAVLIWALMNGTLNLIPKGLAGTVRDTFPEKSGIRREGGESLVWMFSRTLKAWMYLDRMGDMYQWEPKSNPARGKLVTRGMDVFYSAYPEILVNLAK